VKIATATHRITTADLQISPDISRSLQPSPKLIPPYPTFVLLPRNKCAKALGSPSAQCNSLELLWLLDGDCGHYNAIICYHDIVYVRHS
jgi:hypothetical protein